jgi:hypothetical protein
LPAAATKADIQTVVEACRHLRNLTLADRYCQTFCDARQEKRKSPDMKPEASRFGYVVEAARFDVRPIHDFAALL